MRPAGVAAGVVATGLVPAGARKTETSIHLLSRFVVRCLYHLWSQGNLWSRLPSTGRPVYPPGTSVELTVHIPGSVGEATGDARPLRDFRWERRQVRVGGQGRPLPKGDFPGPPLKRGVGGIWSIRLRVCDYITEYALIETNFKGVLRLKIRNFEKKSQPLRWTTDRFLV